MDRNDINCIDRTVAIDISSREPASRKGSSDHKEVTLRGNNIHGVDPCGTRRQRDLSRGHGIVSAERQSEGYTGDGARGWV